MIFVRPFRCKDATIDFSAGHSPRIPIRPDAHGRNHRDSLLMDVHFQAN